MATNWPQHNGINMRERLSQNKNPIDDKDFLRKIVMPVDEYSEDHPMNLFKGVFRGC